MILAAFIELIAKIKQKNNGTFKLVDAQDVECEDGKGLDEALNEKLDKNLGAENTNKVLVTDAEGNIVTQDKEDFEGGGTGNYNDLENKPTINGIELSGNKTSKDLKMYTQEEVNYLLNDKMDKPYYGITITDDTTIENTLAGNFKIDSIEGSIYQAEESGIVPTPERPIPIRSKKITVNGEFVELRSLKESVNIFSLDDFYTTNKVNCTVEKITNGIRLSNSSGVGDSYIELDFSLKANKTYTVSFTADTTNSSFLDVVNCRILSFSASYWANPNWSVTIDNEKGIKSYQKTVTPTVDCKIYLHAMNLGISEQDGYVDFTNIMLVEGDSALSSYVPPTVRDYKIVDHVTKTSKIVRNVLEIDANNIKAMLHTSNEKYISFQLNTSGIDAGMLPQGKIGYCSLFLTKLWDGLKDYEMVWIATASMGISISKNRNISDVEQFLQFVKEKDIKIFAKLATPTEESIPYVETDISEVGLSWQDTTSPSPDIPSEIYEVTDLNIKTTGKNLFDANKSKKGLYLNNQGSEVIYDEGFSVSDYIEITQNEKICINPLSNSIAAYVCFYNQEKNLINGYANSVVIAQKGVLNIPENAKYIRFSSRNMELIQVEFSSVATPYQPYQESSITHHLAKPLRATKDGSIRDVIDVVKGRYEYHLSAYDVKNIQDVVFDQMENVLRIVITIKDAKNHALFKGMCSGLIMKHNWSLDDEHFYVESKNLCLFLNKDRFETLDKDGVINYLNNNNMKVLYQLETPTTEPLEPELVEKLKQLKTFSPVTHVFVTGIAKPTLNAKYPKDIVLAQAQLEQKVLLMSEALTETKANLLLQGGQN